MADGVLHQRLQNQVGDTCVERFGRDLHHYRDPVLETRLLDLQIGLEKSELLAQRTIIAVEGPLGGREVDGGRGTAQDQDLADEYCD